MGICLGPCNNRYRRALQDYKRALAAWDKTMAARAPGDPEPEKPQEPTLRPWEGLPHFCGRCTAQVRAELAELDYAACIVVAAADGLREAETDSKVSGSRDTRSPSAASDDIDELGHALRGWESALLGHDPAARSGFLASQITTSADWLLGHFDPMITHPEFGGDFGQEVRWWHRRLRDTGKSGIVWHSKPMPCSRCHHMSLRQEDGAKYVECSRRNECGRLMSLDEYEAEFEEWQKQRQKLRAS